MIKIQMRIKTSIKSAIWLGENLQEKSRGNNLLRKINIRRKPAAKIKDKTFSGKNENRILIR